MGNIAQGSEVPITKENLVPLKCLAAKEGGSSDEHVMDNYGKKELRLNGISELALLFSVLAGKDGRRT